MVRTLELVKIYFNDQEQGVGWLYQTLNATTGELMSTDFILDAISRDTLPVCRANGSNRQSPLSKYGLNLGGMCNKITTSYQPN